MLYRNGSPYFIKGIAGNSHLAEAVEAGANSFRTWGVDYAGVDLDSAQARGMSVFLNVWLSHNAEDYQNTTYLNDIRLQVRTLVAAYKNHPALLMWSLGNENYLATGKSKLVLTFTNELAGMIHAEDPNHPVSTILVGTGTDDINAVVEYAPEIDVIAINSYAAVHLVPGWMEASNYDGPYVITEWGVNGHWEVGTTSWGWPVEQTSHEKAESYLERYQAFTADAAHCLGSYAFFWGQKQERTPTWYSMFVEDNVTGLSLNGETCPTIDVMTYCWTGSWPANRSPDVSDLTLNNKRANQSVTLTTATTYPAVVTATDPDGDQLAYIWEIQEEPTDLGSFGSTESRPRRIGAEIKTTQPSMTLPAMSKGRYLLFVYVLDGQGHVGTANIPFQVQ